MKVTVPCLLIPSFLALVGILLKTEDQQLRQDILLGVWGGLLGTLAYDLFRWPFVVFGGFRLFATIQSFGLFIVDASYSWALTEAVGWGYHFINGICFGVMYSLVARGRTWMWAVGWGLLIELLAVLSPFGAAFALVDHRGALTIAFLGHVAYGIPLGLVVRRPDSNFRWLSEINPILWAMTSVIFLTWLFGPMLSARRINFERSLKSGELKRIDERMYPDWIAVEAGPVYIYNNSERSGTYVIPKVAKSVELNSGERGEVVFTQPGIYRIFLKTDQLPHSSFVWVKN